MGPSQRVKAMDRKKLKAKRRRVVHSLDSDWHKLQKEVRKIGFPLDRAKLENTD